MGSTRLPGKVLAKVNGRELLSYQLERIQKSKYADMIVVATTDQENDDPIVDLCIKEKVQCFRGSETDVLDRYFQCAKQYGFSIIVRLTADCPLIDPYIIDWVICTLVIGCLDYASNRTPPEGCLFPDGMDVEVMTFSALELAWKNSQKPSEREHVTFYLWKSPDKFKTYRLDMPVGDQKLRLTVDYEKDYFLVSELIKGLYEKNPLFLLPDIYQYIRINPHLAKINVDIKPNQGWQQSLEKDLKAGIKS